MTNFFSLSRARWSYIAAIALGVWCGLLFESCGQDRRTEAYAQSVTVPPCVEQPAKFYAAHVERVIDGDTYEVTAALGFGVSVRLHIRAQGIDTPEMSTPEGKAAKVFAEDMLKSGMVTIKPNGQQTFARWVAEVYISGRNVADILRAAGHVKAAK